VFTFPERVPPAPSCPGVPQDSGSTNVTKLAELLAGNGSVTPDVVLAVSVSEVEVPGAVTLMVAMAVELAVRVPRLQVTTPPLCVQVPCVTVAETKVYAGRKCVGDGGAGRIRNAQVLYCDGIS